MSYDYQAPRSHVQIDSEHVLTVDQLEEMEAKSIWVLNTSFDRLQGAVSFQVEGSGGQLRNVEVPFTFVAINLADSARPRNIIDNEHFRRAVARQVLTIVTPEYAREHNSSREAQNELQKIRAGLSVGVTESSDTANASRSPITSGAASNTPVSTSNTQTNVMTLGNNNSNSSETTVDQRIINIMTNASLSEDDRVAALRTNKSYIKLCDAYYVSSMSHINDEEFVGERAGVILKQVRKREQAARGDGYKAFETASRNSAREALRN